MKDPGVQLALIEWDITYNIIGDIVPRSVQEALFKNPAAVPIMTRKPRTSVTGGRDRATVNDLASFLITTF